LFAASLVDQARKLRKRAPEDLKKIETTATFSVLTIANGKAISWHRCSKVASTRSKLRENYSTRFPSRKRELDDTSAPSARMKPASKKGYDERKANGKRPPSEVGSEPDGPTVTQSVTPRVLHFRERCASERLPSAWLLLPRTALLLKSSARRLR
jgi:hypothetical protein